MSGFLDPKSRIVDAIVTREGKRQMLSGGMKVRFVSFSDVGSQYDKNSDNEYVKDSFELNLEAFSSKNDIIFQVTDDDGLITRYTKEKFPIEALSIKEDIQSTKNVEFAYHELIAESSLISSQSLSALKIISTLESSRDDEGFYALLAGRSSDDGYSFSITNERPFNGEPEVSSISDADSLFMDKRLRKLPNFKYLPPIQSDQNGNKVGLGSYKNLSEINDIESSSFFKTLDSLESFTLEFSRFTDSHDLVMQMFESTTNKLEKLDIIKYGKVAINNESELSEVYFIGKVFMDGFKVPTFVNLFTMVLK